MCAPTQGRDQQLVAGKDAAKGSVRITGKSKQPDGEVASATELPASIFSAYWAGRKIRVFLPNAR